MRTTLISEAIFIASIIITHTAIMWKHNCKKHAIGSFTKWAFGPHCFEMVFFMMSTAVFSNNSHGAGLPGAVLIVPFPTAFALALISFVISLLIKAIYKANSTRTIQISGVLSLGIPSGWLIMFCVPIFLKH